MSPLSPPSPTFVNIMGVLYQRSMLTNAKIEVFIKEIEDMEGLEEFSEECWGLLVDRVVVSREGEMTFCFACGMEIKV